MTPESIVTVPNDGYGTTRPRWLRYSRRKLRREIVGIAAFPILAIFCFALAAACAGAPGPPSAGGFAAMGRIWSVLSFFGYGALRAALRHRLVVDATSLTVEGNDPASMMAFDEVQRAEWRPLGRMGMLLLETPDGRLRVKFSNYEEKQAAILIEDLRRALRPEVQFGWPVFAAVAFPDSEVARREHQRVEVFFGWTLLAVGTITLVMAAAGLLPRALALVVGALDLVVGMILVRRARSI